MDTSKFNVRIVDYDAFPDMSEDEHDLMVEVLNDVDDFPEFAANLALYGMVIELKNPLELTDFKAGRYDTIH